MAQREFSIKLLEFIAALKRVAEKFPKAPKKLGCLGGFPLPNTNMRAELNWMLRMELVGYYTIGDWERQRLQHVILELVRGHPNLIDPACDRTKYIFVLDSPELLKFE